MKCYSWNTAILLAMMIALIGMDQRVWGATTNVNITGFQFVPANVTINVADTVMWTMQDTATIHNAVSTTQPPVFSSPDLTLGQTYSFTFISAGTFPYICTIHPTMQGSVTVQEATSTNIPPELQLASIVDSGNGITLSWTGGVAPYLLQKKSSIMDTNWLDVLTTSELSVTVPKDTTEAFYRVGDQAQTPVIALSVLLSSESEVPATASTATGVGLLSIKGNQLNYAIRYSGLVTNATAAHIHGPASTTNSAGVLFPLEGVTAATAGLLSGVHTLLPEELSNIVAGLTYVNIHSTANSGGEIRGQVVPLRTPVALQGESEVPPVTTPATATGWITLIGNQMIAEVQFRDLSTNATAAHIHAPAPVGQNAGVIIPLAGATGTAGTVATNQSLSTTNLGYLLAGLSYVNIHTGLNPGGEIRGQILPWQFTVNLSGAAEVPTTTSTGTGSGSLTLMSNVLTYTINYSGLSGTANAAHIHGPAAITNAAGVLFPLTGAPGAASGTLSGTNVLTAEQLAHIVTGNSYVNIHTDLNPSGEIRGQIIPKH